LIGAIVLAAGASSRMGRPKAMLETTPGGPTFVETILATLDAAGVAESCVVVPPGLERSVAHGVQNPDPSSGMLSSVQCGLRALGPRLDAVLVWPVDHPLVRRDTVVELIAIFRSTNAPVIVPVHEGRRGHPALFAARVMPELHAADPRHGARGVVHAHDERIELAVADRGVVIDIDTPEDYARAFGAPSPASSELP
jgi:CTP:molybdopterin cytidylyltransferase MocA